MEAVQRNIVYRSSSNGAASSRSSYSAMDLHTTTPSNNRRPMYMATSSAGTTAPGTVLSQNSSSARMKIEDGGGLSARNIVIRRKLMERKRFDSADYAMRQMKDALGHGDESDRKPASSRTSTPAGLVQGKVGASVFVSALNDGDIEMAQAPTDATSGGGRAPSISTAAAPAARSYGELRKTNASATGALSARNVLIQKKLWEKKQFDSADFQMAQYQRAQSSSGEDQSAPSAMDTSDNEGPTLKSPSGAELARVRNAAQIAQMSPSSNVRDASKIKEDKYAGLSGANVLLRRAIVEKKRPDAAEFGNMAVHADPHRYRSQVQQYPAAPSFVGGVAPPAAPAMATQTQQPASKYGKLCAANVLIRKKLKERKRFDSADYNMERARGGNPEETGASGDTLLLSNSAASSRPVNHQVKHIKLSDGASPRWSTPVLSDSRPINTQETTRPNTKEATASISQESMLMARNILLHRKLAQRKRFDSADFFAAA